MSTLVVPASDTGTAGGAGVFVRSCSRGADRERKVWTRLGDVYGSLMGEVETGVRRDGEDLAGEGTGAYGYPPAGPLAEAACN